MIAVDVDAVADVDEHVDEHVAAEEAVEAEDAVALVVHCSEMVEVVWAVELVPNTVQVAYSFF